MTDSHAESTATQPAPTEQPERLDLRSHDIVSDKQTEILRLFPEVRTESGRIDFDRLKRVLGETVDPGKERYGMNWPGKGDCFKAIQSPSLGALLPCREESVNFDATGNVVIEGDNLEVLKLLQKSYLGKIKMIYIDPPYNTGNDFIYPDNYAESLQTYLQYTGQVNAEGRKFGTNTEADGRFHTKWLNMMYPRLYLARNLLREDGAIFVSCDDNEFQNLRALMNEVFGDENFVATVIWQKVYAPKNSARHFSEDHDYIVVYARHADLWRPELLPRTESQDAHYSNPDNDPRGSWRADGMSARNYYSKGLYSVTCPSGRVIAGPPQGRYWVYSEEKYQQLNADRRIWWGEDGNNNPAVKTFLSEVKQGRVPQTLWPYTEVGHTQDAKKELLDLVPFEHTDNVLDTVKPVALVRRMLQLATRSSERDIILDFFAGSGSTGHAVIAQNSEDGGNRQFILVQLPELLPRPETKLKTISDICKQRIRSFSERLESDNGRRLDLDGGHRPDCGFRTFKLDQSNFTAWDATMSHDADMLEQQLELHVTHIRPHRSADDILYELLLKSGFPLPTVVEKKPFAGKTIYAVAAGALIICLDQNLTLELIRAISEMKPERVVCLDEGFAGNDQLKTNAVQTFKSKGIASFKTV
jgi:adenine-specific DNA-methyltransferase